MDKYADQELDPVLHQPVRTRLVAYLMTHGEATFTELKKALEITDGNLEAHMKKLIHAAYIATRRETGGGRPQTFYDLTDIGREAFAEYIEALHTLLRLSGARGRRGK